jgi:hypothetical protein
MPKEGMPMDDKMDETMPMDDEAPTGPQLPQIAGACVKEPCVKDAFSPKDLE